MTENNNTDNWNKEMGRRLVVLYYQELKVKHKEIIREELEKET